MAGKQKKRAARQEPGHHLSLRVSADFIRRADALAAKLAEHPTIGAMNMKRATVFKLAIARGLDVLEREHK